jgi:hypothetical protein
MRTPTALVFDGIFRKDVVATDRSGRALAVSIGVVGLFILAVSATGALPTCRPAWSETTTPPGSNFFYSVAAIAETDVWAIGSHYDGVDDRPLAEHFDGA